MAGSGSIPWVMGMWPMCSTPPAMKMSPFPVMMDMAAWWSALIDEPHSRLMVCAPVVCGIFVLRAANRPTLNPCSSVCWAHPQLTSSISTGSTAGFRSRSASMSSADRCSARTFRNIPPLDRPMGVRTASTTTASFIGYLSSLTVPASPDSSRCFSLSLLSGSAPDPEGWAS